MLLSSTTLRPLSENVNSGEMVDLRVLKIAAHQRAPVEQRRVHGYVSLRRSKPVPSGCFSNIAGALAGPLSAQDRTAPVPLRHGAEQLRRKGQTTGMKYGVGYCPVVFVGSFDRDRGLVGRTLVGRPPCIWAASPSMTRWPPLRLTRLG